MKKGFLIIGIILLLLIVVGIFLPTKLEVKKQIVINAPTNTVYSQIANLRNRVKWDPWLKLDSNATLEYTGSMVGEGAEMSWDSENENVGTGSQKIVETELYKSIKLDLNFMENGVAKAGWTFEGQNDGSTKVTWSFESETETPIIGGYLGLIIEPMVEESYSEGLNNLKNTVESMENKEDFSGQEIFVKEVEAKNLICRSGSSSQNPDDISKAMGEAYGQLVTFLKANKMEQVGSPISVNTKWDNNISEFDACLGVDKKVDELPEKIFQTSSYSGSAVFSAHRGDYKNMSETYNALMNYISQFDLEITGNPWEEYVTDPGNTKPEDYVTYIYFPVTAK